MGEANRTTELPANVPGIGYTLKHRTAVELLITHFCTKAVGKICPNGKPFTNDDKVIMINRAKCHDMDKLLCSLSYPQLTADYFHRMFNGHHFECLVGIQYGLDNLRMYDWIESVFDMESAKYTKLDKGQDCSAYNFMCKNRPYLRKYMEPWFKFFGLDKDDTCWVESIKQDVNRKYYETDLISAIVDYMHTTHIHLLEGISRIDDEAYMSKFNSAVPYRHPATQHPNGTLFAPRPIEEIRTHMSKAVASREFIDGKFEAQLFDLDKICRIPVSKIPELNKKALNIIKELGWSQR